MLKSLQEMKPSIFNAIFIGIPALALFLLIFTTDPFEFSTLELANRLIVYVMLGILSLFGGLLVGGLVKWLVTSSD